jgi:hypothetical protein
MERCGLRDHAVQVKNHRFEFVGIHSVSGFREPVTGGTRRQNLLHPW